MAEKIATFVRLRDGTPAGVTQEVYRVEPPHGGSHGRTFDYVVVSASERTGIALREAGLDTDDEVYAQAALPETYIFGSNAAGAILEWLELDGSFRGSLDHVKALQGAGYTVVGRP